MNAIISLLSAILGIAAWIGWILMLGIGALSSLGVVSATVSYNEAFMLGLGFVALCLLPFGIILAIEGGAD